ncbi:MAG: DUF2268 domain-containing putative Zn-dependent protease [Bacillota bacterium]|nr:DUF2268 domain-containing putative Zn-dependent protease [Bacillota bacterium]
MGVEPTDKWLKEDIDQPLKLCKRLNAYFGGKKPEVIYNELKSYGMYKPSRTVQDTFENLLKNNVWNKVDNLYRKYQTKWSGADVPIFIFPMNGGSSFFRNKESAKSGVSYPNILCLFLTDLEDPIELEALFVHEYHHVCRINYQNKNIEKNTLLDSIMIEGLAEYTVKITCGEKYTGPWCRKYSEKEMCSFWNEFLKDKIEVKKTERLHDELLYGKRMLPSMLGYAAGYEITKKYYSKTPFDIKQTFTMPSEKYLKGFCT